MIYLPKLKDLTHRLRSLFTGLILVAILGIEPCMGQANQIDSLENALNQTLADEERVDIFLQLARLSKSSEREQSISYYREALKYNHDPFQRGVILDTIGLKFWQGGNYSEAILSFKKSLAQFELLKDSIWLGKVNNNIGVVNWGMDNGNEAMKYYQASLRIRRAIDDKRGVSTVLNNMGLIYLNWGLDKEAFSRYQEAMEIALEIDDVNAIAYSNTNLGAYYKYMQQYDKAIQHYRLGFEIESERGIDQVSFSYLLANIGGGFLEQGSLDSARHYYDRALSHAHIINNKFRIATAEYNLGVIYLLMNRLESAQQYLLLSFKGSQEEQYPALVKDNQFALAELEEKLGNYQRALDYYRKATVINDSIFSHSKLLKFQELQIQYNLEQEEIENTLLRKNIEIQELTIHKQNITRFILIASIILIMVILFFIVKSLNTSRELTKRLQKTEKELMDANDSKDRFLSIVSHDLRNPMANLCEISNILESDYDQLSKAEVKSYIKLQNDISKNAFKLLEELLEWAKTHTGKVEYLAESLDLNPQIAGVIQHIGPRALDKNISIENRVEKNTLVSADMKATNTVFRNILSNAIKFTEQGGAVTIEAKKGEEEMTVSISDTGVGMSEKDLNNLFRIDILHTSLGTNKEKGTGLGLILCKELIEKQGGRIWVESQIGEGSRFIFTLPLPVLD